MEGADSARAVVARARSAWTDGDFREVYFCIEPTTREVWLRQLTLSSMLATMGYEMKTDAEERAAAGALASVMKKYGATLTFDERMRGLDLEQLTDALLDGVDDPGGLFGGMVAWAKANGDATDPMRAVDALSDVMIVEAAERAAGIPIPSEAELEAAAPMILRGPPGMARTLARIATDGELRSVDGPTATLWRTKPDHSDETWTLELSETAGRWHITDD